MHSCFLFYFLYLFFLSKSLILAFGYGIGCTHFILSVVSSISKKKKKKRLVNGKQGMHIFTHFILVVMALACDYAPDVDNAGVVGKVKLWWCTNEVSM